MTSGRDHWIVGLSAAAQADFENIVIWTIERFGEEQARRYLVILRTALATLADGPTAAGARSRPDIARGIHSLHAATGRHRARHVVFFRVRNEKQIEIVRILHDTMDIQRHLPSN